jgi:hypothetical protein
MPDELNANENEKLAVAAIEVSKILQLHGYNHCYIGGFAAYLLGSDRTTHVSQNSSKSNGTCS